MPAIVFTHPLKNQHRKAFKVIFQAFSFPLEFNFLSVAFLIQITVLECVHNRRDFLYFCVRQEKIHKCRSMCVSMPKYSFYDPLGVNDTTPEGIGTREHKIYLQLPTTLNALSHSARNILTVCYFHKEITLKKFSEKWFCARRGKVYSMNVPKDTLHGKIKKIRWHKKLFAINWIILKLEKVFPRNPKTRSKLPKQNSHQTHLKYFRSFFSEAFEGWKVSCCKNGEQRKINDLIPCEFHC